MYFEYITLANFKKYYKKIRYIFIKMLNFSRPNHHEKTSDQEQIIKKNSIKKLPHTALHLHLNQFIQLSCIF